MAVVIGDADHLLGEPIIGKPQEGQFYIFDGNAFIPADAVNGQAIQEIQESALNAIQKAEEALQRTIQTQSFLDDIVNDNRIEIPAIDRRLLESLGQNVQLLFMRGTTTNDITTGSMVNGFFDNFSNDSAIDTNLSSAAHDSDLGMFSSVDSISGLTKTIQFYNSTEIDYANLQGPAVYWKQDHLAEGHFEGEEHPFTPGILTNRGNGKVGFPAIGHGLNAGEKVCFYGFYNSLYTSVHSLDVQSTDNEMVIPVDYVPEEITPNCRYRKVLAVGPMGDCPDIETGMTVELSGISRSIVSIDSSSNGDGIGKIALDSATSSQVISRIKGVQIASNGIEVLASQDYEGYRNDSVIDSIPAQTNSDNVLFSSQTATYDAFKVFNDEFGVNKRWLTAVNNTTGWVTYNFGSERKIINKYRWRTFETDSNAVPGEWRLEASDDNVNWTTLHEASNTIQTANTWIPQQTPGYFTFFNDHAYQYYRFHVTRNCGHAQYLCLDEIELIEAPPKVHPVSVMVAYTKPELLPETINWSLIESVDITELKPGDSRIYYSVSFDAGQSWKVFRNSVWKEIAILESGMWKFRNTEDLWESADTNNINTALRGAFAIPSNQMSASEIGNLSVDEWSQDGGWGAESSAIQFAAGLQADGQYGPGIQGIDITYSTKAVDLRLVGLPSAISAGSERIFASLLVKSHHDSLKLFSSTEEPPAWNEFGNLTKLASLGSAVDYWVTDEMSINDSSHIRLKAECDHSHGVEIHGWAVSWS